jgi:hypothetical protein
MNKFHTTIPKYNKTIKVAILEAEPLFWTTCATRFFKIILNNYQWKKNNTIYRFSTQNISDKDIIKNKLISTNIDVLVIPGGGIGDGLAISKGYKTSLKTRKWKKHIKTFIKQGGGCIGFCGGASLITPLSMGPERKPTTFVERQYNKSSLDISAITSYYKYLAFPLLYLFQKNHPEKIGTTAYVFSFEPGMTRDNQRIHSGGTPLDFIINKNHPIFMDYPDKILRIRWWGGQALLLPEKPDRDITILATYPSKELHEQKATKIHAWRYIGGIHGLIISFFKALIFIKNNALPLSETPMLTYYFAGNWEHTNTLITSDLANRAAITTEIYPNENKGRITLCTPHPEYMIWYNGQIQEKDDNNFNCLATGLYQWKDIDPFQKPYDIQITHTWWFVRRLIAWTGKIPDVDLPPIEQQLLRSKEKELLQKNIFWDGTPYNQIMNI